MQLWGLIILASLSAVVLPVRWALKRTGRLPSITRGWKVVSLLVMHGGVLLVIWTTDDIQVADGLANWPGDVYVKLVIGALVFMSGLFVAMLPLKTEALTSE